MAAPPRRGRPSGLGLATGVEEHMILNSAGSETKFAGNGGRVVQRKGQKEQVLERVYPLETTL